MKVTSSTLTFVVTAALGAALLGGCDRRSPTTDQPGAGMPSSGTPASPPSSMMPSPPAMPGASPPPETGK
ncbi:hypothetical protein QN362_12945 [Actimicrobium sp. CCC2.4]|uniref:hypothetical protein n=1 Tax=Actimicrobium sp. CCC2.4 TaxID=3048606 RepID=UPI002AC96B7B|nr:hypothetical protein [Actimicrobium sp. CCC2.4]MEB0136241.1 hypothetical protein [Actimicrobium sp. CCC2.4]WPX33586.1 hypothetical protein RHM62_07100 [Actimicrobium sp. CCC2.4]